MSGPFGSSQWAYSSGVAGFEIADSLRFDDGSSSYLSWTPASAGNRKTWTWSAWVKRGNLGTAQHLLSQWEYPGNYQHRIFFSTNDRITFMLYDGNTNTHIANKTPEMVFRDVSSWYHIVCTWDTTNATAADRLRVYVNGVRQTSFATTGGAGQAGSIDPSQNQDGYVNQVKLHTIGTFYDPDYGSAFEFIDGYLADVYFIDGTALDPTSFGETVDGYWRPIAYSGSYGSNGFHLEFDGAVTDSSGNGNDWTANNISAHDYMPDTPTNNFATLQPTAFVNIGGTNSAQTLSEGNLRFTGTTSQGRSTPATIRVISGKYYAEATKTSGTGSIVVDFIVNDARVADKSTTTTGDIIMAAVDVDAGKYWSGLNGTWDSSGDPETGANPTGTFTANSSFTFGGRVYDNARVGHINFGQDSTFAGATTAGGYTDANGIGDFKYDPGSYLALCTSNLPTPTIIDGSQHFNTVLYTGASSGGTVSQSITGVGFQPAWLWIKSRSDVGSHCLADVIRGDNKQLFTNLTNAEQTNANIITSLDADGFTVGNNSTGTGSTNQDGYTYAAWNWKAGGTAVSNTDGYYTSTVSANPDFGFSIIKWTGDGTAGGTVGHGLTKAPELWISRRINTTDNWLTYFTAVDGSLDFMYLNSTNASSGSGITLPTSTVFSDGLSTGTSDDRICYAFHSSDVIKVGSYLGNGSSNGPFVFTGFRPAWVMVKQSSAAGNSWEIRDNLREPYNDGERNILRADTSDAEQTGPYPMDFLSNGFKPRYGGSSMNGSGSTYIYLAIASTPFKFSPAR